MIPKLTVRISKTADGKADYLQILHGDTLSLNIVLVANFIELVDQRNLPFAEFVKPLTKRRRR